MRETSKADTYKNRRSFIAALGTTSLVGLAGCLGDDDENGDDSEPEDDASDENGDDSGPEDDNGEDDNGEDDNGEDDNGEEIEIDELLEGEVVIDDLYDPGEINRLYRDGSITVSGEEYDGRIVEAETEDDVITLRLVTPEAFDEQGLTDADLLSRQIEQGFLLDDPEEVSENFTYNRFEVEAETVEGEDAGTAFVEMEWVIELFETGDIEGFITTVDEENNQ